MMQARALSQTERNRQAQALLEKEMLKLKRQYLVLSRSKTYSKNHTLLTASRVVPIFENERSEILKDLNRAEDPARLLSDEKLFDELSQQLHTLAWYNENVHRNKVYLKEVDDEIKKYEKQVQFNRKQQVTDRQFQDRIWEAMVTIEKLENKLETETTKFDTICAKNRMLREDIEHQLWIRRIFLKQWEALIEKLAKGKTIMLDLIEQASIAYNQREHLCKKLQVLGDKALHTMTANFTEMREHKVNIARNSKLEEFLTIKNQRRDMHDLRVKQQKKREELARTIRAKLETRQRIMEDIKNFGKATKARVIVDKFAKQEELNFSYFQHVLETIKEMQDLGESLDSLYWNIDKERMLHNSRLVQQQERLLDLESTRHKSLTDAKQAAQTLKETEQTFEELLQGVNVLFKLCKCNNDPLLQLLGNNTTITFYNVHLHIQILEKAIHQLLVAAIFKDKGKKQDDRTRLYQERSDDNSLLIIPIERVVPSTPCPLCVEHDMVTDVIDRLQHVFSRQEAKTQLIAKLQLPAMKASMHRVSKCQLPQARSIIQTRYQ